jgi:predicted dehydrogenase
MKPRVAIAGTGTIGAVHARSARLAGAELVGVSASTPEHADAAATRLGAQRAYESWPELVADPDVELVHVCTPNHLHVPIALAALAAGKSAIVEKPVALDAAGARELAEAAERAGRLVTVPFVYRYYAIAREARERVRTGEIGTVGLVHGSYLQDWLVRRRDHDWRVHAELGGRSRAFADIGSHWCDFAEFLTGLRIERLSAQLATPIAERPVAGRTVPVTVETEDVAVVMLRFAGGALGSVVVSQVAPGRRNRLQVEVAGAAASLAFDQEQPETLWVGRRARMELVARDPRALSPAAARYATLPAGHPQGFHDCFDAFVAESYAVLGGAPPPEGLPTIADGLRAARIVEAVLASADRDGAWVDVAT